jgi:hypothetical protein
VAVERRRLPGSGRTWRLVVAAVVVGVGCGLGWLGWWWVHPSLFGPPGNAVGTHGAVGAPVNLSITFPGAPEGADEVTIERITANVAENTSGATIDFSVCTKGPAQDVMGDYEGDLHDVCVVVRPATEVQLADSDYLMMTATPVKAGVLDVSSFDFTYRYGWRRLYQHGTEETGIRVTVTTP